MYICCFIWYNSDQENFFKLFNTFKVRILTISLHLLDDKLPNIHFKGRESNLTVRD